MSNIPLLFEIKLCSFDEPERNLILRDDKKCELLQNQKNKIRVRKRCTKHVTGNLN